MYVCKYTYIHAHALPHDLASTCLHCNARIPKIHVIHVSFTTSLSLRDTYVWYLYLNLPCSLLYLDTDEDVGGRLWCVCDHRCIITIVAIIFFVTMYITSI